MWIFSVGAVVSLFQVANLVGNLHVGGHGLASIGPRCCVIDVAELLKVGKGLAANGTGTLVGDPRLNDLTTFLSVNGAIWTWRRFEIRQHGRKRLDPLLCFVSPELLRRECAVCLHNVDYGVVDVLCILSDQGLVRK